jgi:Flp pilus assembly protein TadB
MARLWDVLLPGFLAQPSTQALLLGVLAALLVLLLVFPWRLFRAVAVGSGRGVRGRVNRHLAALFGSIHSRETEQLRQADVHLYPADLWALSLGLAIGGVLGVNLAFGYGIVAWLVGGALGYIPFWWLRQRVLHREREFMTLVRSWSILLAGAAQTGWSGQALLEFAAFGPEPFGGYFREVVVAIRGGEDSLQALEALAQRPHPTVLNDVIAAFRLHFETDGPIAGLLKRAAMNIQRSIEREGKMRLRLQGLVSQYWLVCSISVLLLVVARLEEPAAVDAFLGTTLGQLVYLAAWIPVLIVGYVIRRLSRLPVEGGRR